MYVQVNAPVSVSSSAPHTLYARRSVLPQQECRAATPFYTKEALALHTHCRLQTQQPANKQAHLAGADAQVLQIVCVILQPLGLHLFCCEDEVLVSKPICFLSAFQDWSSHCGTHAAIKSEQAAVSAACPSQQRVEPVLWCCQRQIRRFPQPWRHARAGSSFRGRRYPAGVAIRGHVAHQVGQVLHIYPFSNRTCRSFSAALKGAERKGHLCATRD